MAFLGSLDISASGMTAQKKRLDVISENIVNRDTTRTEAGGPYRRKLAVFQEIPSQNQFASQFKSARLRYLEQGKHSHGGVMVSEIIEDGSETIPVYDPNHPDADENGYVQMPNVDTTKEMVDAMAASRSYEANVTAFNAIKAIALKALEIGK